MSTERNRYNIDNTDTQRRRNRHGIYFETKGKIEKKVKLS